MAATRRAEAAKRHNRAGMAPAGSKNKVSKYGRGAAAINKNEDGLNKSPSSKAGPSGSRLETARPTDATTTLRHY
jgi:hypothetical protein